MVRPRRTIRRSITNWDKIREWLNVITAIAALLLAIVSFWTTTRISGLEDYLRSEISRRNSDLNSLSARTTQSERIANARAERLEKLESAADEIAASAFKAQSGLSLAQINLGAIQTDIGLARQDLAQQRLAIRSARSDYANQSRSLDLILRQQAYESASMSATLEAAYNDYDKNTGSDYIDSILSLQPPTGRNSLNSYLNIVKNNIGRVCPSLAKWQPTLPVQLKIPPQPTITYTVGTSKQKIAELTADAQKAWSTAYSAYVRNIGDYGKAKADQMKKLWDIGSSCICETLTTDALTKRDICPDAR